MGWTRPLDPPSLWCFAMSKCSGLLLLCWWAGRNLGGLLDLGQGAAHKLILSFDRLPSHSGSTSRQLMLNKFSLLPLGQNIRNSINNKLSLIVWALNLFAAVFWNGLWLRPQSPQASRQHQVLSVVVLWHVAGSGSGAGTDVRRPHPPPALSPAARHVTC